MFPSSLIFFLLTLQLERVGSSGKTMLHNGVYFDRGLRLDITRGLRWAGMHTLDNKM